MTEKPKILNVTDPLTPKAQGPSNLLVEKNTTSALPGYKLNDTLKGLSELINPSAKPLEEAIERVREFHTLNNPISRLNNLIRAQTSRPEEANSHLNVSHALSASHARLSKLLNPQNSSLTDKVTKYARDYQGIQLGETSGMTKLANSPSTIQTQRVSILAPVQLGSLIKSSRIAKKFTQQQLADLAGVGRRFIVECEAGKPRLEFAKVLQVAAAAGIDIFAIKR
jgi:y4mF family transcriptional regulator